MSFISSSSPLISRCCQTQTSRHSSTTSAGSGRIIPLIKTMISSSTTYHRAPFSTGTCTCTYESSSKRYSSSQQPLPSFSERKNTLLSQNIQHREYGSYQHVHHHLHCSSTPSLSSYFSSSSKPSKERKRKPSFIPRKAPVKLTKQARKFFKALLQNKIDNSNRSCSSSSSNSSGSSDDLNKKVIGIILKYQHSQSGKLRMAFTFDFVTKNQIGKKDEPVSLEVVKVFKSKNNQSNSKEELVEEEIPKSPEDSWNDGLPKLYIHEHAFMKVLGCTIDIDMETFTPILYDREGNIMDPNA